MEEGKPGRKFLLTVALFCIGACTIAVAAMLAVLHRLPPEFVNVVTAVVPAISGALAIFHGSNAYITGKAADNGKL